MCSTLSTSGTTAPGCVVATHGLSRRRCMAARRASRSAPRRRPSQHPLTQFCILTVPAPGRSRRRGSTPSSCSSTCARKCARSASRAVKTSRGKKPSATGARTPLGRQASRGPLGASALGSRAEAVEVAVAGLCAVCVLEGAASWLTAADCCVAFILLAGTTTSRSRTTETAGGTARCGGRSSLSPLGRLYSRLTISQPA